MPEKIGIQKWAVYLMDATGKWDVALFDHPPVNVRTYEVIIEVPAAELMQKVSQTVFVGEPHAQ